MLFALTTRSSDRGPVEIQRWTRRERLPRTESLAEGAPVDTGGLSDHGHFPARGTLRTDQSTPARVLVHPGEFGGGMRTQRRCRVRLLLLHRYGISQRTRISPVAGQRSEAG